MSNFVAVRVGEYVTPRSPRVTAGASLQFSTGALAATGGAWSSSDPRLLQVGDPHR